MYLLGIAGNPRRYAQMLTFEYLQQLQPLHALISIAAFVTITAQLIFVINLFYSMFEGEESTENPWQATTLEWTTTSPPPADNFTSRAPIVYRGAYDYSLPGAASDYLMQNQPELPAGDDKEHLSKN
jgi:cytochrome c oxidase subunit I